MFPNVLFATDFSEYAVKTADHIRDLPGVREVHILHVLDTSRDSIGRWLSGKTIEEVREEIDKRLAAEKARIEGFGVAVSTQSSVIDHGSVEKTIRTVADTENVSLILMGARGRGIIGDLLLGSVSEGVLKNTLHHVLIMKFQTSKEENEQLESFGEAVFSRVLCPVDFSKPSRELLTWIKRIPIISEIVFLHVIKSAESREELQKAILEAEENLGLLRDEFNRDCRDLEVKINVEFGNPAEKICSVAREEDVTLIAIPRHGKSDYITNIPLGSTVAEVAKRSQRPVFVRSPHIVLEVQVRELFWNEFSLAEKIWRHYHGQHADRVNDRIFGVFVEGSPVAVARCKRHPDGLEVDGVFVLNDFRGRGYARIAVQDLVENCGEEPLYMHSTLELVDFYGSFGFREIDEDELPNTIRERFNFAKGELEGANVSPMRRLPGEKGK